MKCIGVINEFQLNCGFFPLLQDLSIVFLRKSFKAFGSIEKIEIFSCEGGQFTHITFKESGHAMFAIQYQKMSAKEEKILMIQPAEIIEQPDKDQFEFDSPILTLSDDCLLLIFEKCDAHDQEKFH